MAKSDCMLAIVWLLRSRGRMTAKELAETLESSVRSVYRYVDSLCASGVPIEAESGREGGYRLPISYESAPLFFTAEERTALAHSAVFAQKAGYPFTAELTGALRKIEYYSTPAQLEDVALHSNGLHVMATVDHSTYKNTLADLERAIANGITVQITYRKAKGQTHVVREVDPYGLVHWRDRWYVVGYCHLRVEVRNFRVDRISEYFETSFNFTRPEGFSASDFFAAKQINATTTADKLDRVLPWWATTMPSMICQNIGSWVHVWCRNHRMKHCF
ncbi:helix-turn-helix transcriptional regulator [Alicyclobacillus dauci]|uniref:YafY family transcriptional regulator n=1 Tax=Alicyclobacillus dauci TaxID=1475485 RepID=A0ABY6Z061_9BACL|nr:YafY family protein [Alicyclobacillus dauci]WAH36259.1 YafY family transcriptional regulator [Alicyclobacillus dauci]WAH39419.1 YafY family transcriptional regulator [Alicyclobacillus dauci]